MRLYLRLLAMEPRRRVHGTEIHWNKMRFWMKSKFGTKHLWPVTSLFVTHIALSHSVSFFLSFSLKRRPKTTESTKKQTNKTKQKIYIQIPLLICTCTFANELNTHTKYIHKHTACLDSLKNHFLFIMRSLYILRVRRCECVVVVFVQFCFCCLVFT